MPKLSMFYCEYDDEEITKLDHHFYNHTLVNKEVNGDYHIIWTMWGLSDDVILLSYMIIRFIYCVF